MDGRSLAAGGGRGIAHYTRGLIGALAARYPGDDWRVLLAGRPEGLPPGVEGRRAPLPRRPLHAAQALTGRPRLDRLLGRPDVVWLPAPAPVAVSRGVPLALTLHDLSWERRPHDLTAYERLFHAAARPRRLAARAAVVLADSHVTRAEALRAWRLDPDRVVVVHPGVTPRAPAGPAPAGRYLLFVGALEPRKAPDLLVRAYARARAGGLGDVGLVLAGAGRLAPRLAGPGVELAGRVDDGRLGALYAGALALVAPSWLEGFGFAPLEAALAGVPSVVSDLPAFRETLGEDGAAFFAPGDEAALAAALLAVACDPARRERLAAAARRRAAGFTWERAAEAAHAALARAVAA